MHSCVYFNSDSFFDGEFISVGFKFAEDATSTGATSIIIEETRTDQIQTEFRRTQETIWLTGFPDSIL